MSRLGRSYAQAFLDAAPQYPAERFLEAAGGIRDALRVPQLKAFFAAPNVPAEAKRKTLEELATRAGVDEFGRKFLQLVLSHRRIAQVPEILQSLSEELDRRQGVVAGRVTVAAPIGDEDRRRIEDSLARQLGRKVRTTVDVDPSILGGFVARIGSQVYDASAAQAVDAFRRLAGEKVDA